MLVVPKIIIEKTQSKSSLLPEALLANSTWSRPFPLSVKSDLCIKEQVALFFSSSTEVPKWIPVLVEYRNKQQKAYLDYHEFSSNLARFSSNTVFGVGFEDNLLKACQEGNIQQITSILTTELEKGLSNQPQ